MHYQTLPWCIVSEAYGRHAGIIWLKGVSSQYSKKKTGNKALPKEGFHHLNRQQENRESELHWRYMKHETV